MNKDLINKRQSKTRKIGNILAVFPFVRCVILNGSLASGDHKKSSDIDLLIIAKSGKIFTCRFFINALTSILKIKRSRDRTKSHAGKFCFNYFLTENYLKIPVGRGEAIDKYCAENYSKSKFIAGDEKLFEKFIRTNRKLFDQFGHPINSSHPERSEGSLFRKILCFTKNDIKKLIEFFFGNWFESAVRKYQVKRIVKDPISAKYPSLIVFNDRELRFHPPKSR